jgi:NTE family protein
VLVQLVDIVLVDRMVEDARTLSKVNSLVGPQSEAARDGHRYRKTPLLFVGPPRRSTLGEIAIAVYDKAIPSGDGILDIFRRSELRLLERILFSGGARGDLLSYLYFDRDFIEESIALGQRDATHHFEQALTDDVPWTSE